LIFLEFSGLLFFRLRKQSELNTYRFLHPIRDRMPRELKEHLEEIGNLINLTANYFNGDLSKTRLWLTQETLWI
jgi:hypothetical protein